LSVINIY